MSEGSNQIGAFLSAIPFCGHLGLRALADGGVTLPEASSLSNHVGTVHAGALFTLGETASGMTALRDLGNLFGGGMVVTKDAAIAYKKPARGPLSAKGRLTERPEEVLARLDAEGKVTFVVGVAITDANGTEVATMNVTWYARRAVPTSSAKGEKQA